jgi:hypothetical protein
MVFNLRYTPVPGETMSSRRLPISALLATVACTAAVAHHSGAMFDRNKKVTVTGTVIQFQYVQPHSWIDVKSVGPDGKDKTWAFEAGAPIQMKMVGLTPDVLKAGDKITITGHPLRDGRSAAAFIELTLPNGKVYNTKPQGGYPGAPGSGPPASASPPATPPPATPPN